MNRNSTRESLDQRSETHVFSPEHVVLCASFGHKADGDRASLATAVDYTIVTTEERQREGHHISYMHDRNTKLCTQEN